MCRTGFDRQCCGSAEEQTAVVAQCSWRLRSTRGGIRRRLPPGRRLLFLSCHGGTGREVFLETRGRSGYTRQPFTVREGKRCRHRPRTRGGKSSCARAILSLRGRSGVDCDFAPGAQTLEGFLFLPPMTPRHPVASELTRKWCTNYGRGKLSPTRQRETNRRGRHKAISRIVTSRSLVERRRRSRRETARAGDRRPPERQRLSATLPVIYGLEGLGKYRGTLTGKDLKF